MNSDLGLLFLRVSDVWSQLVGRTPLADYFAAAGLILFGLLFGKLAFVLVAALLELLRFNSLCERMGIYSLIEKYTRDIPSRLVGRIVYWLVIAFFFLGAVDALQIADASLLFEKFFSLLGQIVSFSLLLVLFDLAGRITGAAFDAGLKLADHPAAGRAGLFIRLAILLGGGALNIDILGIDSRTNHGAIFIGLAAVLLGVAAVAWLLHDLKALALRKKIRARFRVGDRVAISESLRGVIRYIGPDFVRIATESEEHILPATWLLESPVRRENL